MRFGKIYSRVNCTDILPARGISEAVSFMMAFGVPSVRKSARVNSVESERLLLFLALKK